MEVAVYKVIVKSYFTYGWTVYSHVHDIFKLFDGWANFSITTIETKSGS